MRILFDIVHPADVLFFLAPLKKMQSRGDEILILSRHKDVTCDLLDQFGLDHIAVSTAGTGHIGLGLELLQRDWAVLRHAMRFRPHVMLGLGGVAISHVGTILRIPSISFYAADTANLQTRITWPFISHLYVPEVYNGPTPENRTTRFPGIKEMSFFHPENFHVDEAKALKNGWDNSCDNFFIRTVSWRANHDIGKSGWSDTLLHALVEKLAGLGRVHISSERQLPEAFEQYRYRGAKNELHHLMAMCKLYVGESATMAHEAALLGTPAIYDGQDHPGTTRSLAKEGLLLALHQQGEGELFSAVDQLLSDGPEPVRRLRDKYLSNHPNLSNYIVAAADTHARSR